MCGASVSYLIPFTCSPHTTPLRTVRARAEIALRDRVSSGPHGHFAGGDLTDTPAPHQDAGLFRVGNSVFKDASKPLLDFNSVWVSERTFKGVPYHPLASIQGRTKV